MWLRQETDGPQAEQFLPCGQKLHNSRNATKAGWWRRLDPAQIKDHIFLILEVKETSRTTHAQKGSLEVKREGGGHPIVSDVNYP